MDPKCAQNVKPDEVVALARSHVRSGFAEAVGTAILLVRLDEPEGDFALTLEAALEDAPTSSGFRPDPSLGFDTVVGVMPDKASTSRVRHEFTAADLRRMLLRAVHFAVPLQKRKGATNIFADRISVGRSRTNDVVLRHHNVSKFHAWFECDDNDRFYLYEARSTNPTLLNGAPVPKGFPAEVSPGDEVRFGDVPAIFCTPELLWEALMTGGPPPSKPGPKSR